MRRPRAGVLQRHPQWPFAAIALACWVWLVIQAVPGPADDMFKALCSSRPPAGPNLGEVGPMLAAMMLPLALPPLQTVALSSLRQRRLQAMLVFLAGCMAVWSGVALLGSSLALVFDARQAREVAVGLFVAAAGFQLTRIRKSYTLRCHEQPSLHIKGWAAIRDCFVAGSRFATVCLGSCGLAMAGLWVSGHSVAAMLGVSVLLVVERYRLRLDSSWPAVGYLVLALVTALG
jgi:predicted metal-binding membrane protein